MRHYDIHNAKLHDVVVFKNHDAEIVYIDPKHFLLDLGCGVLDLVRKEKAPTIRVHGIEVPAPLQEAPVVGTIVYYPSVTAMLKYDSTVFSGGAWHKNMFERKLFWETMEGAIAYVGALTRK